ncbi:MAG: hypothetical protein KUG73_00120 [Pseudomonadales bacterium]|nr:hypothetical protein [Pseudomonadales bacterium]
MKWVVGGIVVLSVLVWMISMSSRNDSYQEDITELSPSGNESADEVVVINPVQKNKPIEKIRVKGADDASGDSTNSYNETTAIPSGPVSRSIASALDSMRDGLAEGDSRTPPLSEPLEYEQPSLDELNDPVLYQQYEKRQSLNQASAYFSAAVKELPVLRAKIAQARQNGSQTEEEIQEAEEALQKLELMQLEYKWQMPETSKSDIPEE